MENIKWKRLVKYLGRFIGLVSIVFVVKRIIYFDIDYAVILEPRSIIILILTIIVQAIIIFFTAYPWTIYVEIITGKTFLLRETMIVIAKANIMKYIPGNVFQYVGRNELALRKGLKHADVAIATILDVTIGLIIGVVFSFLLITNYVFSFFAKYFSSFSPLYIIGIVLFFIVGFGVLILLRKKNHLFVSITRNITKKRNIPKMLKCIGYYLFINTISSILLLVILIFVMNQTISITLAINLSGAYVFSVIVGLITPGVSGGIGIREGMMLAMASGMLDGATITFAMVIMRFICILADLLSYILVLIFAKNQTISKQ